NNMNFDPMTGERLTPVEAETAEETAAFEAQDATPVMAAAAPAVPAGSVFGSAAAIPTEPRRRFQAAFEEKLTAFLAFIPAYFYAKMICDGLIDKLDPEWRVDLAIFLLGTVGLTIYLFRKEEHKIESYIWGACLLLCGASSVFRLGAVWEDYQKLLFIHGFLLYWIISFSNRQSLGESGCLLPLDAVNVLFIVPFRYFFYRIRTVAAAFRDGVSPHRETENPAKKGALLYALFAILAAGILLPISVSLLSAADSSFSAYVRDFFRFFEDIRWGMYIAYFFLSLPVGAYIYGVLGGFNRTGRETILSRGESFLRGIRKIRQVPPAVWTVLLLIFSAIYMVFFVLQWPWVIDAFKGVCPPDPGLYARESFFALIKVSVINFVLLGITHNSARDLEKKSRILTAAKILLILDNVVFCVISFSKLMLYISTYRFTPLRLQSSWAVLTLFLACAAAAVNILSGKKTMKYWMAASAVLLSGLCMVSW
ncbi:MAG: DUF4173 domain-containing protein, partial [Lachnospiraceae bacterium]|nr:DUF4173 domain-containing protein [Lachnospiraceae bacterium]